MAFTVPLRFNQSVRDKRFSADSRWLLLNVWDRATSSSSLIVIDTKTGMRQNIALPAEVKSDSMTISPSGQYVLLQAQGGYLSVVDVVKKRTKSVRIPWVENAGTAFFPDFAFWPDGTAIWSSGKGDIVRLEPLNFLNAADSLSTLSRMRVVEASTRHSYMHPKLTKDWASQLLNRDNRYISLDFTQLQTGETFVIPISTDRFGKANPVFVREVVFDRNLFIATEHLHSEGLVNVVGIQPDHGRAVNIWQGRGDFITDFVVSRDGQYAAFLIEVSSRKNDAVVVNLETGKEELRVENFSQPLVHSNYFNKNVHVSGSSFVFGSARPQKLLIFDTETGRMDRLEIDSRTDTAHGLGGHLKYAANYYVHPTIDGLIYVAPGSVEGVKLRSGFYSGLQRLPVNILPEAAPQQVGHLLLSPSGEFMVAQKADDLITVTDLVVLRMSSSRR